MALQPDPQRRRPRLVPLRNPMPFQERRPLRWCLSPEFGVGRLAAPGGR